MKTHHWLVTLLILFVVYLIGVKYPSFGQMALAKVGM